MKNVMKLSFLALAVSYGVMAQNTAPVDMTQKSKEMQDKIESARIGMITKRLDLTTEQSTAFWPVYNEYEAKKMEVKKSLRSHYSSSRSLALTDDKLMAELKETMNLRQKEVDLDKDYLNKFLKVINPRQVAELYRTEQMFKQMLLRKFEGQGNKPPQGMHKGQGQYNGQGARKGQGFNKGQGRKFRSYDQYNNNHNGKREDSNN